MKNSKAPKIITRNNKKIFRKIYQNPPEEIKNSIKREVHFLNKYNHPFFTKMMEHKIGDKSLTLDYKFESGKPFHTFLKLNPEYEEDLWIQLLHFVRYLKFHNIALSNLKPNYLICRIEQNRPVMKITNLTIDKNIINVKWSAPEQYEGKLDWRSNLYTFALFFISRYISTEDLKKKKDKYKQLILPDSFSGVIKETFREALQYIPDLRTLKLDNIKAAKLNYYAVSIPNKKKYTSFLEFHNALCETFYSNKLSYDLSFCLYNHYCLKSGFEPPVSISECHFNKIDYIPLSKIIDAEKVKWTKSGIVIQTSKTGRKLSFDNIKTAFKTFRKSYNNWNFENYRTAFEYIKKNLNKCVSLTVNQLELVVKNLRREGLKAKAIQLMNNYYQNQSLSKSEKEDFLYLWLDTTFFSKKNMFTKYSNSIKLKSNSKKFTTLLTAKQYFDNQNIDRVKELYNENLSLDQKSLLLTILCKFSDSPRQYLNSAIEVAIRQKNFYQIANLLSFRHLVLHEYDKRKWEYSLIISLAVKCPFSLFITLYRQFQHAYNNNDMGTIRNIMNIYEHEVTSPQINPRETKNTYKQMAHYYYKNELFNKCEKFIYNNIDILSPKVGQLLLMYLDIASKNHKFSLPEKITELLKKNRKIVKKDYRDDFYNIISNIYYFAPHQKRYRLQKILAYKIKPKIDHELFNYQNLLKKKKNYQLIKTIRTKLAAGQSKYLQAERYFYLGLAYKNINQNQITKNYLNLAQMLFNKIGLFNRSKTISKILKSIAANEDKADDFGWFERLNQFRNITSISQFNNALEDLIFNWLGFEVTIPFVYNEEIDNFTPLEPKNKHYFETMEALKYSKKFLKQYKNNPKVIESFANFSIDNDETISLLNIDKAFCIPINYNNKINGILYIHTNNPRVNINKQQQEKLKLFLYYIAPIMNNLAQPIENQELHHSSTPVFHGLIGNTKVMNSLKKQIKLLAKLSYSVLITGESGVGKELVAKAIFEESERKGKLITINCPNISRELFESELFGHQKGAFSGAVTTKKGKIAEAEDGVVFFDEIGDMPLSIQAKLLRVIENRTYFPVGSNQKIKTKTKFIFATNKNLDNLVEKSQFRSDLLARIKQFTIEVPPLAKHSEDIPLLVNHFTEMFKQENPNIKINKISTEKMDKWMNLEWKMNVRQLKYEVYRELLKQDTVTEKDYIFQVSLKEKLDRKALEKRYVQWLQKIYDSPKDIINLLNISYPTYYRILKREE